MKVKALKDFYLKAGQRVASGELLEVSDTVAAQLVLRKSVEYVKATYETKVVEETPIELNTNDDVETPVKETKRKGK